MDDHVSGVQRLVHLWNKSGMQTMVLLSFGMQVFLLVFGTIRWRSSSAFVRLSLWYSHLRSGPPICRQRRGFKRAPAAILLGALPPAAPWWPRQHHSLCP
ncbi:hypothetical protein PVAP13_3KG327027 [Panicum virgatum]|uniref:Uncharacterized protein n=1 Tax=Panicum virgatum TaxID=38727 RepID=A0A8T0UV88_PANVG|nr:hypothetical protein PVAP13_3KG327027 [Panicum virgatum]